MLAVFFVGYAQLIAVNRLRMIGQKSMGLQMGARAKHRSLLEFTAEQGQN